jgi:hypothetical protein
MENESLKKNGANEDGDKFGLIDWEGERPFSL